MFKKEFKTDHFAFNNSLKRHFLRGGEKRCYVTL